MASEPFQNFNIQYPLPLTFPSNEGQGILEALSSHSSFKSIDNLGSDTGTPELNMDLVSEVMNSTFREKYSNSRSAVGDDADTALANLVVPPSVYMQSADANIEPYMNLPSFPMSYSGNNPMNIFSVDNTLSYLRQGTPVEKQKWESVTSSTEFNKSKLQSFQDSFPVQKREPLTPVLKKSRCDVSQENIEQQQQQIINEFLLKELHDYNPQLMAMIEPRRLKNQLQPPVLHSVPLVRGLHSQLEKQVQEKQMTNVQPEQGAFAPLLDGGLCSQRFRQYLIRLRSHIHDNSIGCWRKFVSEYYAPDAKKRWCFSNYENIELHVNGVFCSKSMETWSCDLCGSKSGRGLEAIFDVFPRLLKAKFDSGMLDEMLCLDSPRACKISSGLMLEYKRAVQESVYEKFRVVHEGKLRIVFRNDLKILSWEFCAKRHEEYLVRELITPQVNQMTQAAKKYLKSIQNGTSSRMSLKDVHENYEMFESELNRLKSSMELPLVNALGYPKRFIRCLQIAEVVDSMTDLMTISHKTKMGATECLNNYGPVQNLPTFLEQPGPRQDASGFPISGSGSGNMGLALANLNCQLLGERYNMPSLTRKGLDTSFMDPPNQAAGLTPSLNPLRQAQHTSYSLPRSPSAGHGKRPNQSLLDKLLHDMIVGKKGKSTQETFEKPNDEAARQSNASKGQHCGGESSNAGSSEENSADVVKAATDIPEAPSCGEAPVESQSIAVKEEPPSSPEA